MQMSFLTPIRKRSSKPIEKTHSFSGATIQSASVYELRLSVCLSVRLSVRCTETSSLWEVFGAQNPVYTALFKRQSEWNTLYSRDSRDVDDDDGREKRFSS